LGGVALGFALVSIYRRWSRKKRAGRGANSREEEQESDNVVGHGLAMTPVRSARRKSKLPKLWDVRVPKLGSCKGKKQLGTRRSFYDDDLDDDDDMYKDDGKWDTMKPISVAYIKNPGFTQSVPPSPNRSLHSIQDSRFLTPMAHNNSSSLTLHQATEPACDKVVSSYDKAAIEAVQVSVLISMPKRPEETETVPTAGPLELGVVNVGLGSEQVWKQRPWRGETI